MSFAFHVAENDDVLILDTNQNGTTQEHIFILTTMSEISRQMDYWRPVPRRLAQYFLRTVLSNNIQPAVQDMDRIYAERGEDWQNFCDDFLIYSVLHKLCNGTDLPISNLSWRQLGISRRAV